MKDKLRRAGARCLLACAAPTWLTSCRHAGVLDPQGPISAAERLILFNATAIMLVVVAPVIVMTLAFAWWYRASNRRAAYRPDFEYSGQIELVVWAIPAMVVLLLAGVTWISSHELDPRAPLKSAVQPLRIEVVSLDWKWLFIYPDHHIAAVNALTVPAGTPLEFSLTSASVMNSFFIPQLGTQIYTMPGMTTHVNLMADNPGDYPGMSAHFSGDGFSDMRFIVHAVHPADFAAWVQKADAAPLPLDVAAYEQLEEPSSRLPVQIYNHVEPMLFDHILQLAAPMGAPMHH
jgi:cytochrome o ubiquinol oxidase subunit 2